MTQMSWLAEPQAVHLVADESTSADLERQAREQGASVVRLSLAEARDRPGLSDLLARTFLFPHEARGLDAAVDLISDLEWLGNPEGYLVVTDMSEATEQVIAAWAEILPAIVDRWRSQRRPFVAVLIGGARAGVALHALSLANAQLQRAGQLAWAQPGTGPVAIIDHISATGSEEP
jgi:hypothetical protein